MYAAAGRAYRWLSESGARASVPRDAHPRAGWGLRGLAHIARETDALGASLSRSLLSVTDDVQLPRKSPASVVAAVPPPRCARRGRHDHSWRHGSVPPHFCDGHGTGRRRRSRAGSGQRRCPELRHRHDGDRPVDQPGRRATSRRIRGRHFTSVIAPEEVPGARERFAQKMLGTSLTSEVTGYCLDHRDAGARGGQRGGAHEGEARGRRLRADRGVAPSYTCYSATARISPPATESRTFACPGTGATQRSRSPPSCTLRHRDGQEPHPPSVSGAWCQLPISPKPSPLPAPTSWNPMRVRARSPPPTCIRLGADGPLGLTQTCHVRRATRTYRCLSDPGRMHLNGLGGFAIARGGPFSGDGSLAQPFVDSGLKARVRRGPGARAAGRRLLPLGSALDEGERVRGRGFERLCKWVLGERA